MPSAIQKDSQKAMMAVPRAVSSGLSTMKAAKVANTIVISILLW